MSDTTRNLWGKTKADKIRVLQYIDLEPQATAPPAYQGRVYVNASGAMQICEDGTNYLEVTAA